MCLLLLHLRELFMTDFSTQTMTTRQHLLSNSGVPFWALTVFIYQTISFTKATNKTFHKIEYNQRTCFEFTTRTDSSFRIYTVYLYMNSSSLLVITHLWANCSPSPHSSYEDHILFHNGLTFGVDC